MYCVYNKLPGRMLVDGHAFLYMPRCPGPHLGGLLVLWISREDWFIRPNTWEQYTCSGSAPTAWDSGSGWFSQVSAYPFLSSVPCRLAPDPPSLWDIPGKRPRRWVTWKEVKESSVNSLTKRRVPRACSSITKAKMTSCVPRSGMSVRVDLASLERGRDR